jgi:hypothetical protein
MNYEDMERLTKIFVNVWCGNSHLVKKSSVKEVKDYQINGGWCYQFALVMKEIYPNAQLMMNESHVWVMIGNGCYDSTYFDCDPRSFEKQLWRADGKPTTVKEVEEYWNPVGISGEIQWDIIKLTARVYKGEIPIDRAIYKKTSLLDKLSLILKFNI